MWARTLDPLAVVRDSGFVVAWTATMDYNVGAASSHRWAAVRLVVNRPASALPSQSVLALTQLFRLCIDSLHSGEQRLPCVKSAKKTVHSEHELMVFLSPALDGLLWATAVSGAARVGSLASPVREPSTCRRAASRCSPVQYGRTFQSKATLAEAMAAAERATRGSLVHKLGRS